MKYSLYIFDLDGTVLDTLDDLADSVNYALSKHQLPCRSKGEIRAFVGNGIRRLVDLAVPEHCDIETVNSVFDAFKAHYNKHSCDKTRPYDGIISLLADIKNQGAYTAVVSNKADFAVKNLVEKYFDGLFSYSAGEKEGVPRKPSPEAVYNAIEYFGLLKNAAVYIGDSEVDIETAANAGIDSIIVSWGFRDEKTLTESGAKTVVRNTDVLRKLIFD